MGFLSYAWTYKQTKPKITNFNNICVVQRTTEDRQDRRETLCLV